MHGQAPEGHDFLRLIWKQEDAVELDTDKAVGRLGKKAPKALQAIGTVLSLMARMGSCWWGCRKGNHVIEYLCGRVTSTSRASLRLMRLGFYDESLSLSRSIGEVSNLLSLFHYDSPAFDQWMAMPEKERLREFGPVRVRIRLEQIGVPVPSGKERYGLLSQIAAHVNPGTKPQAHNLLGVPSTGAMFQEEGILVALNELAIALSCAALFGVLLLRCEPPVKKQILRSVKRLMEQIGGANITEIAGYRASTEINPQVNKELKRIAGEVKRLQAKSRGARPTDGEP